MTLDEEIEYLKLAINILEVLQANEDSLKEFKVDLGNGKAVSLDLLEDDDDVRIYLRYRHDYSSDNSVIFSYDNFDYINLRANEMWTLNFFNNSEFGREYSITNSNDFDVKDEEIYFDDILKNENIITEEQYFQFSLIHDDLPSTYEDVLKILDILHNRKNMFKLRGVSASVFIDDNCNIKLLRTIRRLITHNTGIKFA